VIYTCDAKSALLEDGTSVAGNWTLHVLDIGEFDSVAGKSHRTYFFNGPNLKPGAWGVFNSCGSCTVERTDDFEIGSLLSQHSGSPYAYLLDFSAPIRVAVVIASSGESGAPEIGKAAIEFKCNLLTF
jgi:hypothetical protein